MSKTKRADADTTDEPEVSLFSVILRWGPLRWLCFTGLVAGMLGVTVWMVWQHVRDLVAAKEVMVVQTDEIEVTPEPDWIRTDVKQEVIESAGLNRPLSLLDESLTRELQAAFALHPWVRKVHRVAKGYPGKIEVRLEYRRPVLMVEVPGGLYPVDVDGVLLPSIDFSPKEAAEFPWLGEVTTSPGGKGMPWGDVRVSEAARIAEVLLADWQALKLHRILPGPQSSSVPSTDPNWYYFVTKSGRTRVLWGHAPGTVNSDEPSPQEKLSRLKKYAEANGSLDHPQQMHDLDLRPGSRLMITPRVAKNPQEPR